MSSTTMVEATTRPTATTLPLLGKLKIMVGDEVLHACSDAVFVSQWDALYEACPWATIFQSSRFASTWYANYAASHTPILIISTHEGMLTGLLALAENIPQLGIAGVGGYDAYYHLWLTTPALSDAFITSALLMLRSRFPGKDICLKYITPNVPVNWITDSKDLKDRCVTRQFSRPILDLSQLDEKYVLSRKQFREKNNRLKRLGAVTFRVISDADEFETALSAMVDHYDIRKAATYNITPFKDDPAKKQFLIDLVKQDILTAAVLKVDDQVCAIITATVPSKGWTHGAGVVVHNLKFSKMTPGYIIMKLFSLWLKKYPDLMLDITPGDHSYKNQHASGYDTLLELRVTSTVEALGFRTVYYAKEVAKDYLAKRQIQPSALKERLQHLAQAIRQPASLISTLNQNIKQPSPTLYRLTRTEDTTEKRFQFRKDTIADLLLYDEKTGKLPAHLFTKKALHEYESGQELYTCVQDGKLACVVWVALQEDQQKMALSAKPQQLPDNAVLLHGLCTFNLNPKELPILLSSLSLQLYQEYTSCQLYLLTDTKPDQMPEFLQLETTD